MQLTTFARQTLADRYMAPQDQTVEDIFTRAVNTYTSGSHRDRMNQYVTNQWFIPSTPVLANAGTARGNPIACFLSKVQDSRRGILGHYTETGWLASNGGGVGTDWSKLRTIGAKTSKGSQSNGMLPFQAVVDRLVVAFAQGSSRRASYAGFLKVSHPEIMEFIDMRKPTGGDINRKNLNLHHGVVVTDEFLAAVRSDSDWNLIDPHSKEIKETLKARKIWEAILEARSFQGEPYIVNESTMDRMKPNILHALNVPVDTSNLCTEITVATQLPDGTPATGVCCLGSLNIAKWDEFKDQIQQVVEDCLHYLWLVLDSFVQGGLEGADSARNNAAYYRDVGLGTVGWHSLLQSRGVPFCNPMAVSLNRRVYSTIHAAAESANISLLDVLPPCQASVDAGIPCVFTHMLAIAPNASTSIFVNASPGIEPYTANAFVRKTASGTVIEKNPYLQMLLRDLGQDTEEVWTDIIVNSGSVQHLDFLDAYAKEVYLTAYEMDQRWLVQHVADRQPFICQAQSLNLYFLPGTSRKVFNRVHLEAMIKGCKTLYYSKGLTKQKASTGVKLVEITQRSSEEECLACSN